MKKLWLALALCLAGISQASAANCSSNPYTLINGQVADATQVMANFNNLLTCSNTNLAHNGANSDITSLSGLTTPLTVAQGGTGLATITANSLMIGNGTGTVALLAPGAVTGYPLLNVFGGQPVYGQLNLTPGLAQPVVGILGVGNGGTGVSTSAAGGDLTGNYPNPTLATVGITPGFYSPTLMFIDAKGRVTGVVTSIYTTGNYTPVPGGSFTESHGLGNLPSHFLLNLYFRCLTGEGGYSSGDVVEYPQGAAGGTAPGTTVWASNTQVGASFLSSTVSLVTKGGGGGFNITPSNWQAYAVLEYR